MSWIDDNDFCVEEADYYFHEKAEKRYLEARDNIELRDLCVLLINEQCKITEKYREITVNIANKGYLGQRLTEKQKNALYNAYAFMSDTDDDEEFENQDDNKNDENEEDDYTELLQNGLIPILKKHNTGSYSYNEKAHANDVIKFFKRYKKLL